MLLFGRFFLNRPFNFYLMNWKILIKLECSFVPSQKCGTIMNTGGSSGYGAAMPLIGDMLGAWSTSYTNDTNERIARKNREWQSAENEKQRQWEYDRWLEEQEYNTPVNQMERYRQAGINPFLMSNNGNVGSGQTSVPSAPAPVSSPNMPNIHPFDFSGMRSLGAYLQNQQMVDANTFNQQADAFNKFVDAAMKAYSDGKTELGDKILYTGFAQLGHFNTDTSYAKETILTNLALSRSQVRLNNASANIEENYSPREAEERITKLQDECMQIHAQIGLWSSMAKLYDKYGERADAEIVKLIADSYKSWIESSYVKSLKATEDEKRQWYVANLLYEAANNGILFSSNLADFEENKGVREYKSSPEAQNRQWYKYTLDNTYVGITYDKLTKMANQATGSFTPYKNSVHYDNFAPWQTNYRKRERTYSGSDGSSVRLTDYLEK